jgi:hypothetical protein
MQYYCRNRNARNWSSNVDLVDLTTSGTLNTRPTVLHNRFQKYVYGHITYDLQPELYFSVWDPTDSPIQDPSDIP